MSSDRPTKKHRVAGPSGKPGIVYFRNVGMETLDVDELVRHIMALHPNMTSFTIIKENDQIRVFIVPMDTVSQAEAFDEYMRLDRMDKDIASLKANVSRLMTNEVSLKAQLVPVYLGVMVEHLLKPLNLTTVLRGVVPKPPKAALQAASFNDGYVLFKIDEAVHCPRQTRGQVDIIKAVEALLTERQSKFTLKDLVYWRKFKSMKNDSSHRKLPSLLELRDAVDAYKQVHRLDQEEIEQLDFIVELRTTLAP
jgi:hypothetical protein